MLPKQLRCIIEKRLSIKTFLQQNPHFVSEIRQGIERECLRVDKHGHISKRAHPKELGHKLTHKCITTDYAENLLEFITGVHGTTDALFNELRDIHHFTYESLGDEMLWCQSMPALLPDKDSDIPIAHYGESNIGKLKTLYRKGLGYRYGRSMQSIAGIHYNFSFTDNFWEELRIFEKNDKSLTEFKNDKYFHLIRNYRRYSWLLVYLYGATTTVDKGFLKGKKHNLEQLTPDTYFSPKGTSLRMGGLGYTSSAQASIGICYNKLDTYIDTLEKARLTSFNDYTKIGLKSEAGEHLQLNDHLLQIDNEFYSNIRPKNLAKSRESALGALYNRGIEYIEVRLLDVNPFEPIGVKEDQVHFLHLFLSWCLFKDSPIMSSEECLEVDDNFDLIVKKGRCKDLSLLIDREKMSLHDGLKQILSEIETFSTQIFAHDKKYEHAFKAQLKCIENKDELLSSQVLEASKSGYIKTFKDQSLKAKEKFLKMDSIGLHDYKAMAQKSFEQERVILSQDKLEFDDFLKSYFEDIKISL